MNPNWWGFVPAFPGWLMALDAVLRWPKERSWKIVFALVSVWLIAMLCGLRLSNV